jgi:hypothetical protein
MTKFLYWWMFTFGYVRITKDSASWLVTQLDHKKKKKFGWYYSKAFFLVYGTLFCWSPGIHKDRRPCRTISTVMARHKHVLIFSARQCGIPDRRVPSWNAEIKWHQFQVVLGSPKLRHATRTTRNELCTRNAGTSLQMAMSKCVVKWSVNQFSGCGTRRLNDYTDALF